MKQNENFRGLIERLNNQLRNIDVFGAEIGIKYEGKSKYTSRCGGLSTLIVISLLISLLYQQCMSMYERDISNIIFEQKYVDIPSRYYLTPNSFSFMIGIFNSSSQPVIDELIYYLEGTYYQKQLITKSDGSSSYIIVPQQLQIAPCSYEDFQQENVKEYFTSQSYQSFYCIKNQNNLYLEGQFDKNVFSSINIEVKECIDEFKCKKAEIRKEFLSACFVQLYYTHRILELSNFNNPFRPIGKTQFYNIFYDNFLITNFIFSNTEVVDDIGLFVKDLKIQKQLQFVTDRSQLTTKSTNSLFQCALFLEKNNENTYKRNYKKIPELISSLGGTFQVLFFFGCFFLKPYNYSKLQNRLYKDIFSEKNKIENAKNQSFRNHQKKIQKQKPNTTSNLDEAQIKQQENKISSIIESQPTNQTRIFPLLKKIKDYFIQQKAQYIIQQKQKLDSLQSLKSIMNLQIQFKTLQRSINEKNNTNISISKQHHQQQQQQQQSIKNHDNQINQNSISEKSFPYMKRSFLGQTKKEQKNSERIRSAVQRQIRLQANQFESQSNFLNQSLASITQLSNQNNILTLNIDKIKKAPYNELSPPFSYDEIQKDNYSQQQTQKIIDENISSSVFDNQEQKINSYVYKNTNFENIPNKILSIYDLENLEPTIKYKNNHYTHIFQSIKDKNLKQESQKYIIQKNIIQNQISLNNN